MLVCFDVRSEKVKFIVNPAGDNKIWLPTIINYKGKLGALEAVDWEGMFDGRTKCIKLWVLDDFEEQSHVYILPPLRKNVVAHNWIYIAGMTRDNEIVFASLCLCDPFYIFYYNMVRNNIVRVEVRGICQ